MTRQIDVKAIISHIVNGDGSNKCRICMGETYGGQVHLGNSVMMDGKNSVTLAELLELITGVKMSLVDDQPKRLCGTCADSTKAAVEFRLLCQQADSQWQAVLTLLNNLSCNLSTKHRTLYAIVDEQRTTIIKDCDRQDSITSVVRKVNAYNGVKTSNHPPKMKSATQDSTKCPYCGIAYKSKSRLYVHLKESSDLKRACYICADIMSRDDLLIHLEKEHNEKVYGCVQCPNISRTMKEFEVHKQAYHSKGIYNCQKCQRIFDSHSEYSEHRHVHVKKKCSFCKKVYPNQPCYMYHMKLCGKSTSNIKVKASNKSSRIINNKSSKVKKTYKPKHKSGTFKCDYCGKIFYFRHRLVAHIKCSHMKITIPCDKCGKLVPKEKMKKHLRSHDLTFAYNCEYCGLALKTIEGYRQHIRIHTGEKPFKCKYCDKAFYSSSHHSQHVRRTHLNIDRKKFPCKMCPSQLLSRTKLKRHMKVVHKHDIPAHLMLYKCSECGESFDTICGLLSHKRMKHRLKTVQEN